MLLPGLQERITNTCLRLTMNLLNLEGNILDEN